MALLGWVSFDGVIASLRTSSAILGGKGRESKLVEKSKKECVLEIYRVDYISVLEFGKFCK